MPEISGNSHPIILHVGAGQCCSEVEKLLAQACTGGARVEAVWDVYCGLARLGSGSAPLAVLVCTDSLIPCEFEFFKLAGQVCRGVQVYVYSAMGAHEACQAAIRAGAAGEFDANAINSLRLGEACSPRTECLTPPVHTATQTPGHGVPSRAASETSISGARPEDAGTVPTNNGDSPHHVGDEAEISLIDENQEEPVRVPWIRYEDQSSRVPPRRTPPAEPTRARGSTTDAPLLTEEEVRALIGDDVSSFPSRREENH